MQNQAHQINWGQVPVPDFVELICSAMGSSNESLNGMVMLTISDRQSCKATDQQFIVRIHR